MTTIKGVQPVNRHARSSQNQPSAHFAQRLRRWAQALLGLGLFFAVWAQTAPAIGGSNRSVAPPGARQITILDQNLYVGSPYTPVLILDPTDTNYVPKLLMAVAEVYQTIVASDFPKRAQALAGEIAATQPDLVSLQEVSLIRIQVPGDLLMGGTTPASDVQLDYLAILLANLNQHGVHYAAVAIVTNMDIELPMPTGTPAVFADVRLTDHDVILARVGVPPGQLRVSHPQAGNFQTALPLPSLGEEHCPWVVLGRCHDARPHVPLHQRPPGRKYRCVDPGGPSAGIAGGPGQHDPASRPRRGHQLGRQRQ